MSGSYVRFASILVLVASFFILCLSESARAVSCQQETTVLHYPYIGACGYTKTTSFTLTKQTTVTRIRIWYDSSVGGSSPGATLVGPGGYQRATSSLTLGGSQWTWTEALWALNETLSPGTYTLTFSSNSVCANPSGDTTLVLYGCDAPVVPIQSFDVSANASGPVSSLTLNLELDVATNDIGLQGDIFLAALVPNAGWFLHDGTTWQYWNGGVLPEYFSGTLPATINIPVVSQVDVSSIVDTQIYAGYGLSVEDMFARGLVKLAYTITEANTGSISTGSSTTHATTNIGQSGGTISLTSGTLAGLVLTVPADSYADSRQFKVSSAPVTSHTFGNVFNPLTPLIKIENGGDYSEEIMTVKIPVTVPANHFAMAFYYDPVAKTLEGIPTIEQDEHSITIATRHFSSIIISSIDQSLLNRDIDTHFRPGIDDWQFVNRGSYIAPGGHCAGQTMTALWYYYEQPDGKDLTLFGRYDNNGNQPATPNLDYDDSRGYRLASVAQKDHDWDALFYKFSRKWTVGGGLDLTTWQLFAYSMVMTGQPQYVAIFNTVIGGGHAMIVYRIVNGQFYIADPNYPGNTDRRIAYASQKLAPYNSGANKEEIDAGNGKAYDQIFYIAKSSVIDWGKLGTRWAEMQSGTIGDGLFPAYNLVIMDENNTPQPLTDGYVSTQKLADISVTSPNQSIEIYRDGVLLPFDASWKVELNEGVNKLGIYIQGQYVDSQGTIKWKYIDFKQVNVSYNPGEDALSDSFPSNTIRVFAGRDGHPDISFTASGNWSITGDGVEKVKVTQNPMSDGSLSYYLYLYAPPGTQGRLTLNLAAALGANAVSESSSGDRRYVYSYYQPELLPPVAGSQYFMVDSDVTANASSTSHSITIDYIMPIGVGSRSFLISPQYDVKHDTQVYDTNILVNTFYGTSDKRVVYYILVSNYRNL